MYYGCIGKRGGKTVVHKELAFSWATGTVREYNSMNIFHLAGITGANNSDKFYKGQYNNQIVFDAYYNDPTIFDHISTENATYEYVKVIIEYINNVYIAEKGLIPKQHPGGNLNTNNKVKSLTKTRTIGESIKRFKIISKKHYNGTYVMDETKKCCEKNVWRSNNTSDPFIIFWTGSSWVLTYSKYEDQIGPTCGGLVTCGSLQPYSNQWNAPDVTIEIS